MYEKQLHTTSHKPGIKSGEVEFEIPKEVPAGEDDEIDWFVVVRLDIPNWPDTKDEFKLNVAENAGEERV